MKSVLYWSAALVLLTIQSLPLVAYLIYNYIGHEAAQPFGDAIVALLELLP